MERGPLQRMEMGPVDFGLACCGSFIVTSNKKYKDEAYKWVKRLESRKNDKTFDVCFLFYLSYAVKKVEKSIKLKDFPHITENGEWVMLGKKILCFYMWDYYFIEAVMKLCRGVVCK